MGKARTISGIYCQLGDYMPPTTLYKNLKNVLNARVKSPAMSAMLTRLVLVDCGLQCWNCHDLNTNNRHDTIDLNSKKNGRKLRCPISHKQITAVFVGCTGFCILLRTWKLWLQKFGLCLYTKSIFIHKNHNLESSQPKKTLANAFC